MLLNKIEIDVEMLKQNFMNLILDENSSSYLWILYSKEEQRENYIDKISDILKRENKVIRGGVNTYKINGWMTHTLYVYQIVNENIARNTEILNFNGNVKNKKQVEELHKIYQELNEETRFILKIFCLIHDIGVIEAVKNHDKLGSKYVEKVLQEIGINQLLLDKYEISMDIKEFTKILQELIKNHTLITSLSGESSDHYVEVEYRNFMNQIPEVKEVKKDIPKVLLLLAYGDVIAVDESIMEGGKYERIKEGYEFFEQITQNKKIVRDKKKVAIERMCDTIGEKESKSLLKKLNHILEENRINREKFWDNMYHIKLMRFTTSLMKTVKDIELTMIIFYELFELIESTEGKEELKNYTIIFVPDRHENDFVEQFKNGNFFKCIRYMKEKKENEYTYGNINIKKEIDLEGKNLNIRVI